MDYAVGLGGGNAKRVQIGQRTTERLRAGGLNSPRRSVRASKRQECVPVVDEFSDDGRAD